VKTDFEKYILDASKANITLRNFMLNMCSWTASARASKLKSEFRLWTVLPNVNTSWIKGADKKGQHEVNNVETKGDKGGLKRKYTDAVNTSSSENPPAVGSSSTSLCNVCKTISQSLSLL
jgi:hypothetical protein